LYRCFSRQLERSGWMLFLLNCFKIDNKKAISVRISLRGQHRGWTVTRLVSASQAKDSDLLKDVGFFCVYCYLSVLVGL
jgi:hypothetical protein